MSSCHVIITAIAACLFCAPGARGAVLVLRDGLGGYFGTEDTVIRQGAPNNNSGGSIVADINGPSPTPPLLKFKGLDILQGNYLSIDAVTLTLTQYDLGIKPSQAFTVNVRQIADANAAWREGTQDNQPSSNGGSTWNNLAHHATTPTPWTGGPGLKNGGVEVGQIGSFHLTPQTGSPQYVVDLEPSAIVEWIEEGPNNAGMYLEQANPVSAWWGFLTRQSSNPQFRPTLTIQYTPVPEPAVSRFGFGWYDTIGYMRANQIGALGASTAIAANANYTSEEVGAWLNFAGANGLKVAAGISQDLVTGGNLAGIQNYVQEFDSHPAVTGWVLYETPAGIAQDHAQLKSGYDAIKQKSSKPVSVVFWAGTDTYSYFADTYDHIIAFSYPCWAGEGEFDAESFDEFKAQMEYTGDQATSLGKTWSALLQAFGGDLNSQIVRRLPTFDEAKFMTYYAVQNGASSAEFYPLYRTNVIPPVPGEAYPHGGVQWQSDVFVPLAAEMELLGSAIGAGTIGGVVNDDAVNVQTSLFQDPDTDDFYLLAMNTTSDNETTEFTLNLSGFASAKLLFENGELIPIIGGQFTDTFSGYEVHVYRLVIPEPSASAILGIGSIGIFLVYGRATGRSGISA